MSNSTTADPSTPNISATADPVIRWYRNWPDYDPALLILAFLVAVQAAYVSVFILKFHFLRPMVVLGALTFSVGSIFCMHFIAMAAESHTVPMSMSTGWTIGSIFFAFIPTALAMLFLTYNIPHQMEQPNTLLGNWHAFKNAPHLVLIGGAFLMALGTAAMHWTATIGMFPVGQQHYDVLWVAICCVYLFVACIIALHCCFVLPLTKQLALPTAVVLSVATTGFHVWGAVLSVYVEINQSLVMEHPMNEMKENASYIVFLSTMMSFVAWFIANHFSRNSHAVTDETKPVTIVFTDVQSSTRLYAKIPHEMHEANEKHLKIMLSQLQRFNGHFVKSVGDSIMAVFADPHDALAFMTDTQIMLNNLQWDPRINLMYTKMARKALHKALREANGEDAKSTSTGQTGEAFTGGQDSDGSKKLKQSPSSSGIQTSSGVGASEIAALKNASGMSSRGLVIPNGGSDAGSSTTRDSTNTGDEEGHHDDFGVAADLAGAQEGAMYNGLRVRMGCHHGLCSIVYDETQKTFDYFGNTTNCSARVESSARGGQILVTRQLIDALGGDDAVRERFDSTVESHGHYALRGMMEPVELIEVTPEALSLRRPFAPPNAVPADEADLESTDEFAALERSFLQNQGKIDEDDIMDHIAHDDDGEYNHDNNDHHHHHHRYHHHHHNNSGGVTGDETHNNNNFDNNPHHGMTTPPNRSFGNSMIPQWQLQQQQEQQQNYQQRSPTLPSGSSQIGSASFDKNNHQTQYGYVNGAGAPGLSSPGNFNLNDKNGTSIVIGGGGGGNTVDGSQSPGAPSFRNQANIDAMHASALGVDEDAGKTNNNNRQSSLQGLSAGFNSDKAFARFNNIRGNNDNDNNTNQTQNQQDQNTGSMAVESLSSGTSKKNNNHNSKKSGGAAAGGGGGGGGGGGTINTDNNELSASNQVQQQQQQPPPSYMMNTNEKKNNSKDPEQQPQQGDGEGSSGMSTSQNNEGGRNPIMPRMVTATFVPPINKQQQNSNTSTTNNNNNNTYYSPRLQVPDSVDTARNSVTTSVKTKEFNSCPAPKKVHKTFVGNEDRSVAGATSTNHNNNDDRSSTSPNNNNNNLMIQQQKQTQDGGGHVVTNENISFGTNGPLTDNNNASNRNGHQTTIHQSLQSGQNNNDEQQQIQQVVTEINNNNNNNGGSSNNTTNNNTNITSGKIRSHAESGVEATAIFENNTHTNNTMATITTQQRSQQLNQSSRHHQQQNNYNGSDAEGTSTSIAAGATATTSNVNVENAETVLRPQNHNQQQDGFNDSKNVLHVQHSSITQNQQQQQQSIMNTSSLQPSQSHISNNVPGFSTQGETNDSRMNAKAFGALSRDPDGTTQNLPSPSSAQQQQHHQRKQQQHQYYYSEENLPGYNATKDISRESRESSQRLSLSHMNNTNNTPRRSTMQQQQQNQKAPEPAEVYDFVISTVHRLVRKRFSVNYVQAKLKSQLDAFEILLHKITDIRIKRRLVGELATSWGHYGAITENMLMGNPTYQQSKNQLRAFNNSGKLPPVEFTDEEISEMDKELKCALTILAGRVISRMLQLEVAGSNAQAAAYHQKMATNAKYRKQQEREPSILASNNRAAATAAALRHQLGKGSTTTGGSQATLAVGIPAGGNGNANYRAVTPKSNRAAAAGGVSPLSGGGGGTHDFLSDGAGGNNHNNSNYNNSMMMKSQNPAAAFEGLNQNGSIPMGATGNMIPSPVAVVASQQNNNNTQQQASNKSANIPGSVTANGY